MWPHRTEPEINLFSSSFNFPAVSSWTQAPKSVSKISGLNTWGPEIEMYLSLDTQPVRTVFPIFINSWYPIVQIWLANEAGEILWICVPTSPIGCGPEKIW